MLKIKLTRVGKKGQPQYRIIVAEAKSKRDTKYTDLLGYYNPLANPAEFRLDMPKYGSWLKKGAQPTPTIRLLAAKVVGEIKTLNKPKTKITKPTK